MNGVDTGARSGASGAPTRSHRSLPAWRLAARLLVRDWRSGELYLLAAALVLTVAAITAVGFFTDRVAAAIERQGSTLLAADLVVDSTSPIPEALIAEAESLGLETARTLTFRSVVFAGERSQLVEVKAASPTYPLRGELAVRRAIGAPEETVSTLPGDGEVWVEPRLLYVLGLELGDALGLGRAEVAMTRLLAYEPDRGANFFQIAPRVLMALDQVEATGLVT